MCWDAQCVRLATVIGAAEHSLLKPEVLLGGACSGSRQLLRALFRSSVLDSISLYGGLAIFFLVVAYILQVCCNGGLQGLCLAPESTTS
jgi:hypothetical protein